MKTTEAIREYAEAFAVEKPTKKMDPKSIAYGMRLARDVIKYVVAGAIDIVETEKEKKPLRILLESMDTLPIVGESCTTDEIPSRDNSRDERRLDRNGRH